MNAVHRFVRPVILTLCLTLASAHADSERSRSSEDGFVPLFDGKTLDHWLRLSESGEKVPVDQSAFSVQDGTIHCTGRGRDYWLAFDRKFRDCVLRMDYKIAPGTNSGIFLRPEFDNPAYKGYEVQIIDDSDKSAKTGLMEPTKHTSCSIYDVLTPMRNLSRPVGEWNSVEITHDGSHVVVVLNGFKVIDADFAELTEPIGKFDFPYAKMPREGYVGVQNHGGELWFRNVRIKTLDDSHAAKPR